MLEKRIPVFCAIFGGHLGDILSMQKFFPVELFILHFVFDAQRSLKFGSDVLPNRIH